MRERPRRVTLRDVAVECGLSVSAVSYALRGIQVPESTQERVRDAADRLGYQVDPIARALASGRTGYVGLVCGSLEDIWQQDVAATLGRALLDVGRHALIVDASNSPELEQTLAAQLVDQRVDAVVALWVDPDGAHWAELARRTVLVSIGDGLPQVSTAAEVVFDNEAGVEMALAELHRAGHRRVAVMTPHSGRRAELAIAHAAPRYRMRTLVHRSTHDLDTATAVAGEALDVADPPTAFFCLADSLAYGVYAAARRRKLRIPDDVSVLGYDDHPVSALLTPPLSSFHWPVAELVGYTVERTVRAIEQDKRSRRMVLSPEPRRRASVAAPVSRRGTAR